MNKKQRWRGGGGWVLGVFRSPKSRKRRLLSNHYVELFWPFCKTYFFRGIPFRFIPFRTSELALPRKSEFLGMSTFFRGITETVPSLFRGIFSERNSVPNPNLRISKYSLPIKIYAHILKCLRIPQIFAYM
jgi:hypothetical protein